MKTCTSCDEEKPLDDYYVKRRSKDGSPGHTAICRPCHNKQTKKWRVENADRMRELNRRHYENRRREVFMEYGGECVCCGEDGFQFLSIDHIDGRTDEDNKTGIHLYRYLKKMGYPKDRYQLLCHNCNQAKWAYGKCPHQTDTVEHMGDLSE